MTVTNPGYGMKTLEIIRQLKADGVRKISVLMRHSARHYDEEHAEREPLMWLTEEGKTFAYTFGKHIPEAPLVRFYSSMLGRCIETAYQADKGYTAMGGKTESNVIAIELAPSFVKAPIEVFKMHREIGTTRLFREWFAGNLPEDLVGPSQDVADLMIGGLTRLLRQGPESHIDFAVSHDWNLFMIKHHLLDLDFEKIIHVEYLEGIVLFVKDNAIYITNHESETVKLN